MYQVDLEIFYWISKNYDIATLKAPTHRPDSNQQPTAFIRPLCCLSSNLFGRKIALNTPLRRADNSTAACALCTCVSCNMQVTLVLCIKKTLDESFMHATLFTFDQNET